MLIRILAAAFVAILITAGIAIGLGNMPEAGADDGDDNFRHRLKHVKDSGNAHWWSADGHPSVDTDTCAYHLHYNPSFNGKRYDLMKRAYIDGEFRTTSIHGGTIQQGGSIWITYTAEDIKKPTFIQGIEGFPTRADADAIEGTSGAWLKWQVEGARVSRDLHDDFDGPYAEDFHRLMRECAENKRTASDYMRPTPTPTPSPTPTATPTATSSPTPTATVTATPTVTPTPSATPPPASVATPRPTATPRSGDRVTATATPTTIPTPSPTATPETPGAGGTSGDDPDLAEVLRQLTAALSALMQWLSNQPQ